MDLNWRQSMVERNLNDLCNTPCFFRHTFRVSGAYQDCNHGLARQFLVLGATAMVTGETVSSFCLTVKLLVSNFQQLGIAKQCRFKISRRVTIVTC